MAQIGCVDRTLYPHPFSKAYWRQAADEFRNRRMLVFAALMIALRVALKPFGIPIAADLRINIAFFINAFCYCDGCFFSLFCKALNATDDMG